MRTFAVTAIVAIAGPAFGGPSEVVATYAEIAEVRYVHSLAKAEGQQQAVAALVSGNGAGEAQIMGAVDAPVPRDRTRRRGARTRPDRL